MNKAVNLLFSFSKDSISECHADHVSALIKKMMDGGRREI